MSISLSRDWRILDWVLPYAVRQSSTMENRMSRRIFIIFREYTQQNLCDCIIPPLGSKWGRKQGQSKRSIVYKLYGQAQNAPQNLRCIYNFIERASSII